MPVETRRSSSSSAEPQTPPPQNPLSGSDTVHPRAQSPYGLRPRPRPRPVFFEPTETPRSRAQPEEEPEAAEAALCEGFFFVLLSFLISCGVVYLEFIFEAPPQIIQKLMLAQSVIGLYVGCKRLYRAVRALQN